MVVAFSYSTTFTYPILFVLIHCYQQQQKQHRAERETAERESTTTSTADEQYTMGYRNIVAAGTHSRAAAAASSRGRKCGAVLQYYVVSKYVVHKLKLCMRYIFEIH